MRLKIIQLFFENAFHRSDEAPTQFPGIPFSVCPVDLIKMFVTSVIASANWQAFQRLHNQRMVADKLKNLTDRFCVKLTILDKLAIKRLFTALQQLLQLSSTPILISLGKFERPKEDIRYQFKTNSNRPQKFLRSFCLQILILGQALEATTSSARQRNVHVWWFHCFLEVLQAGLNIFPIFFQVWRFSTTDNESPTLQVLEGCLGQMWATLTANFQH